MKWFAPKILKSEYDKVVADNMELKLEINDLRAKLADNQNNFKKENVPSPIKNLNVNKLNTIYNWKENFTPKELIIFTLEELHESKDIKKFGSSYYKKGEKIKVADLMDDGRMRVSQKFMLECFNELTYVDKTRMPPGSLIHIYNAGLIEVSHCKGYPLFNFYITSGKPGYILTNYAVSLYNEED